MSDIVNFNFKDSELRTILIYDKPYFCIADLRNILNIPHNSSIFNNLKDVVFKDTLTNGGKQELKYCSEQDLYKITLRSNSKVAEPFQDWVCGEVLPQLRKTGRYEIQKQEQLPQINSQFLLNIANKMAELEKKIEEDKPLVQFATDIAVSSNSVPVGDFAKIIFNEFKMGQNKLFAFLRENEFLMKDNKPYQKYLDNGTFEIKEGIYETPYGKKSYTQTLITGKGQIFLTEKIKKLSKNRLTFKK